MSWVPCSTGQITSRWLNLINSKIPTILHHCCYVYLLHIPAYIIILLYIKSTVYCSAHFILLHILFFLIFIFHLYLFIFSCVVLHILHRPQSGPDLIYISLLIIFCIIDYGTNKTLNLEESMMSRKAFNNVYRRCLAQPHVVLFFPPLLIQNWESECFHCACVCMYEAGN